MALDFDLSGEPGSEVAAAAHCIQYFYNKLVEENIMHAASRQYQSPDRSRPSRSNRRSTSADKFLGFGIASAAADY